MLNLFSIYNLYGDIIKDKFYIFRYLSLSKLDNDNYHTINNTMRYLKSRIYIKKYIQ